MTRYEDVITVLHAILRRPHAHAGILRGAGRAEVGPIAKVMVKQMLFMDAPAHTRLRKLAGVGVHARRGSASCATTSRRSPPG